MALLTVTVTVSITVTITGVVSVSVIVKSLTALRRCVRNVKLFKPLPTLWSFYLNQIIFIFLLRLAYLCALCCAFSLLRVPFDMCGVDKQILPSYRSYIIAEAYQEVQ